MRVSIVDLEQLVFQLNEIKGYPTWSYVLNTETGEYQPQPNAYRLNRAHGGVALDQMCAEGSGVRRISKDGFGTKRQLYSFLCGMIEGARTTKKGR